MELIITQTTQKNCYRKARSVRRSVGETLRIEQNLLSWESICNAKVKIYETITKINGYLQNIESVSKSYKKLI